MSIEFMKNGFEFVQDDIKKFIPYNSISYIEDVYTSKNYSGNYDVFLGRWTGENVSKYVAFDVHLIGDKQTIAIHLDDYIRNFPRISDEIKKMNLFKFLFLSCLKDFMKDGCSKEALSWLKDKNNVSDLIKDTEELRNKIIGKINEWKKE